MAYICETCGRINETPYCGNCNKPIQSGEVIGMSKKETINVIDIVAVDILGRIETLEQQNKKLLKSISTNTSILAVIAIINAIFAVLGALGFLGAVFR